MTNRSSPTSVYKFFDAQGALLYVGVTSQGPGRFYQHNRQKEWWPEVATTQIEHYPTRDLALEREKELIKLERPRENIQHLPGGVFRNRDANVRPLAESRAKKPATPRRDYFLYTTSGGKQYNVYLRTDWGNDPRLGFAPADPTKPELPPTISVMYFRAVDLTTGRRRQFPIGSLAAMRELSPAHPFVVRNADGSETTYHITYFGGGNEYSRKKAKNDVLR